MLTASEVRSAGAAHALPPRRSRKSCTSRSAQRTFHASRARASRATAAQRS